MNLLIIMILMISLMTCFVNHPLTLGFILLVQTLMIALLTGIMSLNFWSSYIIFIIMIGGLLILFIYMTSVASNEKFKFSFKLLSMMMFMFTFVMLMCLYLDKFLITFNMKMIETFSIQENMNLSLFLNKFIHFPYNMIYTIMVVYLLITLIAVVKMTTKTKKALRKNF
uniref:NADH-ubiquinone oxidoreductase chain 6 n=1 Tax=Cryptocephalus flavolimbatus TaxID=2653413 RepID=A0A5Q0U0K4_9CUCU|nr:NADH dehydrogenase subunit 6 [Cryptocephalus flavolimbatus]